MSQLVTLKPYTYLNLEEVADWLKFGPSKINASGDTKAFVTVQDLKYTSKLLNGANGNLVSIKLEDDASVSAGSELVSVSDTAITVKIDSGVSTAAQVKTAIEADFNANRYLKVDVTGTASNPQTAVGSTMLVGGANSSDYDGRLDRVLTKIINASCDKVEAIIGGPVLTREFTEYQDGSDSNVLKPHLWPIRSVKEVRIDYNRAFGDTSILPVPNYFLRGGSDSKQPHGDLSLSIIGNDVVLRDDNERFVLGRIFSGSVLGSIKLTYTAGWGDTPEDLPQDILLATTKLMEYWYMQRENRDINLTSKGVKGESYSRIKDGIPEQIFEDLEQYIDVSLGTRSVPQKNYFRI